MRISRKCYDSSFFHVMIQGIRKEKIFNSNYLKCIFLNYMTEAAEKNDIKIVAYCIMANHVHMLLYADDIENLSKMMHSLNTRYAMKYNKCLNRCGFVFRDRYRCENIHDIAYLKACIKYIHNNPVKARICEKAEDYYYSSYNSYTTGKYNLEFMNEIIGDIAEWLLEIKQSEVTEETFIDVDNEFGDNLNKTPEKIIEAFNIENKLESNYISNQDKTRLIKLLNEKYGISKVEISKILGISRSQIYRLQNRYNRDVR